LILLDTHVLAWLALEPKRLSRPAATAIRRAHASGGAGVASITLWELAQLFASGRIRTAGTVEVAVTRMVEATRTVIHELSPTIAALATQFGPDFPKDPADRMIAATARAFGVPLITADERIQACPLIQAIW
jgi:PIN domain nuclease of toxin-antitoxin system